MTIGKGRHNLKYLMTQNYKFETVSTFSYLGVTIGKTVKEITEERIDGMETTTINKKEEDSLLKFERKIMKTIQGHNVTRQEERRMKTNAEIEKEKKGENIVRYIKSVHLECIG
uniref:Uncharacterized protein LOC114338071 n=1 Tax=Diabrotica virgifera virgifera TaxID=50390 RepID=A0A6P7GCX9_DIAVI